MLYYLQPPYFFYIPLTPVPNHPFKRGEPITLYDYGPQPITFDIEETTKSNNNFRLALWSGNNMQLTLMSLLPGESIGLERHPNTDQFIRIEQGKALVQMSDTQDLLNYRHEAEDDDAILIPAGKWHNITNIGNIPLKLYSLYAPPEHPHGTIQPRK
ncbi:MAG TPA: cupin domain-containing protein [Acholeplasmataceae bacterium]|nr:cupin domain-containing protein [Acholeplasmataceae bacterium]